MPTTTRTIALALAATLLATLTLTGCGMTGPANVSGDVIQREHERARTISSTCYRTKYSRAGKRTTTRRVPYSCTQNRPEKWRVLVSSETGQTAWLDVSRSVYRDCTVGDWYDATERDC